MSEPLARFRAAEESLWSAMGATPKEHFVEVGQSRMRLRVLEVGDGPPALFVPGVFTGASAFAPLIARLGGLRCFVLDRPGCGLSDGWQLQPRFRDQATELLGAVVDALGVDSVHLAGSSLGALWVTWLALARPSVARSLTLLGPSIGFAGVKVPLPMRVMSRPWLGAIIRRLNRPSPASMRAIFSSLGHQRSIDTGEITPTMIDWGVRLNADTPTLQNEVLALHYAVGFGGARSWTYVGEDELRGLHMPVCIIAGDGDPHGGASLAEGIARAVPDASLHILPGVGHLPWLDTAQKVADIVGGFTAARPEHGAVLV